MDTLALTDTPRVSVIVPVYNRRDYLRQTLESIRAQTFSAYEVIVVDDGSKDGSAEAAREFAATDARFRCVTQENSGCATARNHGLSLSDPKSEFVTFLDSDDLWTPNALASLLAAAEKFPGAALVYTPIEDIVFIDHAGDMQAHDPIRFPPYSEIYGKLFHRPVTPEDYNAVPLLYMATCSFILSPGATLIRKTALGDLQFDTNLINAEDWEFWIRFSDGRRFQRTTDRIYQYRIHEGSKSKNYERAALSREMIYRKLGSSENFSPEFRKLVREAHQKHFQYQILLVQGWRRQALKERHWTDALRLSLRILKFRFQAFKATARKY